MEIKTIFLTGGTGYIGNRLAHYFANKNYLVKALCRDGKKESLLSHPNIEIIKGDLDAKNIIDETLKHCDLVIHAAAFAAIYTKNPELFYKINVENTQFLIASAKKNGVKKFIYSSSAGSLGPSENHVRVSENSKRIIPFFNEYERTKHLAEEFVLNASTENFVTYALNISRVFGPGLLTETNGTTRLIEKIAFNNFRALPGNGDKFGNYVYIEDVIKAHENIINFGKGGNKYIIGGENLSYTTFFNEVKKQANASQNFIPIPVIFIHSMAYLMLFGAKYFNAKVMITPQWSRRYMYDWILDNTKAHLELHLNFTKTDIAIRETIEWLKLNKIKENMY